MSRRTATRAGLYRRERGGEGGGGGSGNHSPEGGPEPPSPPHTLRPPPHCCMRRRVGGEGSPGPPSPSAPLCPVREKNGGVDIPPPLFLEFGHLSMQAWTRSERQWGHQGQGMGGGGRLIWRELLLREWWGHVGEWLWVGVGGREKNGKEDGCVCVGWVGWLIGWLVGIGGYCARSRYGMRRMACLENGRGGGR